MPLISIIQCVPFAGAAPYSGPDAILPVIGFVFFMLIAGILSAAETAVFSMTPYHLQQLRNVKRGKTRRLEELLRIPDRTLFLMQLGQAMGRFGVVAMAITAGFIFFPDVLWHALVFSALISAGALFLVADAIPRSIAMEKSAAAALALAWPVGLILHLLFPFRLMYDLWSRKRHSAPATVKNPSGYLAEGQLKALIETGDVEGLLSEPERTIIDAILDFKSSTADEILRPRPDMESLSDTLSEEEMRQALRETNHSRIPLYHESLDNIVSIIHVKEVLLNPDTPYHDLARQPLFIPPKRALTDLLGDFQRARMHLAIVVDEYGGTSGIVTLADLLQEIINAFEAEGEEAAMIRRVGENRWIVLGNCDIDEFNEELGVQLPQETSRTVGGFVTALIGRFPRLQEVVRFETISFTVLRMDAHRVRLLRVQRESESEESKPHESFVAGANP